MSLGKCVQCVLTSGFDKSKLRLGFSRVKQHLGADKPASGKKLRPLVGLLNSYLLESFVTIPHFFELSSAEGEDNGRNENERNEVEEGRLGRVHHEQGDERHHHSQRIA